MTELNYNFGSIDDPEYLNSKRAEIAKAMGIFDKYDYRVTNALREGVLLNKQAQANYLRESSQGSGFMNTGDWGLSKSYTSPMYKDDMNKVRAINSILDDVDPIANKMAAEQYLFNNQIERMRENWKNPNMKSGSFIIQKDNMTIYGPDAKVYVKTEWARENIVNQVPIMKRKFQESLFNMDNIITPGFDKSVNQQIGLANRSFSYGTNTIERGKYSMRWNPATSNYEYIDPMMEKGVNGIYGSIVKKEQLIKSIASASQAERDMAAEALMAMDKSTRTALWKSAGRGFNIAGKGIGIAGGVLGAMFLVNDMQALAAPMDTNAKRQDAWLTPNQKENLWNIVQWGPSTVATTSLIAGVGLSMTGIGAPVGVPMAGFGAVAEGPSFLWALGVGGVRTLMSEDKIGTGLSSLGLPLITAGLFKGGQKIFNNVSTWRAMQAFKNIPTDPAEAEYMQSIIKGMRTIGTNSYIGNDLLLASADPLTSAQKINMLWGGKKFDTSATISIWNKGRLDLISDTGEKIIQKPVMGLKNMIQQNLFESSAQLGGLNPNALAGGWTLPLSMNRLSGTTNELVQPGIYNNLTFYQRAFNKYNDRLFKEIPGINKIPYLGQFIRYPSRLPRTFGETFQIGTLAMGIYANTAKTLNSPMMDPVSHTAKFIGAYTNNDQNAYVQRRLLQTNMLDIILKGRELRQGGLASAMQIDVPDMLSNPLWGGTIVSLMDWYYTGKQSYSKQYYKDSRDPKAPGSNLALAAINAPVPMAFFGIGEGLELAQYYAIDRLGGLLNNVKGAKFLEPIMNNPKAVAAWGFMNDRATDAAKMWLNTRSMTTDPTSIINSSMATRKGGNVGAIGGFAAVGTYVTARSLGVPQNISTNIAYGAEAASEIALINYALRPQGSPEGMSAAIRNNTKANNAYNSIPFPKDLFRLDRIISQEANIASSQLTRRQAGSIKGSYNTTGINNWVPSQLPWSGGGTPMWSPAIAYGQYIVGDRPLIEQVPAKYIVAMAEKRLPSQSTTALLMNEAYLDKGHFNKLQRQAYYQGSPYYKNDMTGTMFDIITNKGINTYDDKKELVNFKGTPIGNVVIVYDPNDNRKVLAAINQRTGQVAFMPATDKNDIKKYEQALIMFATKKSTQIAKEGNAQSQKAVTDSIRAILTMLDESGGGGFGGYNKHQYDKPDYIYVKPGVGDRGFWDDDEIQNAITDTIQEWNYRSPRRGGDVFGGRLE